MTTIASLSKEAAFEFFFGHTHSIINRIRFGKHHTKIGFREFLGVAVRVAVILSILMALPDAFEKTAYGLLSFSAGLRISWVYLSWKKANTVEEYTNEY